MVGLRDSTTPLSGIGVTLLTVEHALSEVSNQFGHRFFATAGPTLWNNSLPVQLQQPDITFKQFKQSLKMFMFG